MMDDAKTGLICGELNYKLFTFHYSLSTSLRKSLVLFYGEFLLQSGFLGFLDVFGIGCWVREQRIQFRNESSIF